ncbi:MAG: WecB/TagA/CpsF family glycosyltransferase [Treponema sp.]|nr:WecB/TagA/CpsF family glycosyltransferase [Treponema sp.]
MNRIEILGVPVDVVKVEDLEKEFLLVLEKKGTKQIVFLTIWDLIKASRKKSELRDCLNSASIILPISKTILFGAKVLKKEVPVRYNPFTTTISLLSTLENYSKSLFLFGGRKKALLTAEKNVHTTFSGLQIVGRYIGYYPKSVEDDIVMGLYKSSPSLALVADGIKEKNLWAYHRRNKFKDSVFLYYRDIIGIFSERIRRPSEKTFEKGHEFRMELVRNPLKLFLLFPFLWYIIKLLYVRLFKITDGTGDIVTVPSVAAENAEKSPKTTQGDDDQPSAPVDFDVSD